MINERHGPTLAGVGGEDGAGEPGGGDGESGGTARRSALSGLRGAELPPRSSAASSAHRARHAANASTRRPNQDAFNSANQGMH